MGECGKLYGVPQRRCVLSVGHDGGCAGKVVRSVFVRAKQQRAALNQGEEERRLSAIASRLSTPSSEPLTADLSPSRFAQLLVELAKHSHGGLSVDALWHELDRLGVLSVNRQRLTRRVLRYACEQLGFDGLASYSGEVLRL